MSFRGRLRLFFTIIVIVPMIAVALVLFSLAAENEAGKADAGIATGFRNAFTLYSDESRRAEPVLRRVARDPSLRLALRAGGGAAATRLRALARREPSVASIELYSPSGQRIARAGSRSTVAPANAPLTSAGGGRLATLSVSLTDAESYARRVARLSGLGVAVFRGSRPLASTLSGGGDRSRLGRPDHAEDVELDDGDHRARVERIGEAAGPPVEIAMFRSVDDLSGRITEHRLLIGVVLAVALLLALAFSVFVVRALQAQIGQFLEAARRLARGDFEHPVPTQGGDEFAALGHEFNSMSEQLAGKIDEVERKRRELEETIRRVGAAFASGLDRQGVVELAVETAVDACEADTGRALPVDESVFEEARTGTGDADLGGALEIAESRAYEVRQEATTELLRPTDGDAQRPDQRRAVEASVDSAHALAAAMRVRRGPRGQPQNVGVLSIARHGRGFSEQDRELLEYLAGQAVVSIENADLHDVVQRQAVTDELTGLSNVRKLHSTLDLELERSRRFSTPLGLVMLDIDDFKKLNDDYGHQQGDEVLAAVGHALLELSRDIDEPARYGGEELAVVLPQTACEGAAQVAERMREAIEQLRIPRVDATGELRITASFGVSSIPDSAEDKRALIAAADAALYRAKRSGKNRVERAEPVAASR